LKPCLGFFSTDGDYKDNWKIFKETYKVSGATLNVLLIASEEEFLIADKKQAHPSTISICGGILQGLPKEEGVLRGS